jgi:WXG100 family type VII secretion target
MAYSELRCDYDAMANVSNIFANQGSELQDMFNRVRGGMDALADTWEGRGSDAFKQEMAQLVLPASMRLIQAMNEAAQVSKQINDTIQGAEDEASSLFRGR